MLKTIFPILMILAGGYPAAFVFAAENPVVINEIAWMGTKTNSSDEWIELYNNTEQAISLENWGLYEAGGKTLIEPLLGIIEPKSYYLIERTDDTTINDIIASQKPSGWGGYGLKNSGEHLQLLDQNSVIIDEINCSGQWFNGDNETKQTMEKINPQLTGNNPENWQTSAKPSGTPKAQNSKPSIKIKEDRPPLFKPVKPDAEDEAVKNKPQQPEPKSEPSVSSSEALPKSLTQNQSATIGEQIPKSSKSLYIFLIAFALSVFSGATIFLLKKRVKE